ncbi:hypothetical protein [Thalassotalea agarivorans]|nr:hypothetical protein [Thalassotalea agarivorans]
MKKQRGNALAIALFLILVLLLLGSALVQMLSSSSEAIAQEVLGTRALAAATAGANGELAQIFPLDGKTGAGCRANFTYNFAGVDGLNQCRVFTSCANYANNDGIAYYRIESIGECGIGISADEDNAVVSSRTIKIEARSL